MNVGAVDPKGVISDAIAAEMPRQDPAVRQSHPAQEEGMAPSHENIKRLVEEMQSHINRMDVSLQYSTYGERGEKIAVAVVDKETGEVIREIPSKEIQSLYMKMSELAGMIFNRQA